MLFQCDLNLLMLIAYNAKHFFTFLFTTFVSSKTIMLFMTYPMSKDHFVFLLLYCKSFLLNEFFMFIFIIDMTCNYFPQLQIFISHDLFLLMCGLDILDVNVKIMNIFFSWKYISLFFFRLLIFYFPPSACSYT